MSWEKAYNHLKERGMAERAIQFEVSSATVALAAAALSCEPAHIAKTLSFADGEGCILVVAAGDRKIDNKSFKARFGFKPRMLSAERVSELTGHQVGGVCPFGVDCPVYLDESLKRFETVYPACGTASSAVRLSPEELFELSGALDWVDVTKAFE
ncbi:MAG: YbaK/EbsC family protein [Clostridia bacterium]|nr:YbaK/EbsC family protein [Clostridia bacterium]